MALSNSLGAEYMDQFYRGAYFRLGDRLCLYKGHVSAQTIRISSRAPNMERWSSQDIPTNSIQDMGAFAWPKLGYRDYMVPGTNITSVWLLSTARSAMRGLQERHIKIDPIPQYNVLTDGYGIKEHLSASSYMMPAFFPKFHSYSEGMRKLENAEAIAFSLNEDFAVAISVSQGPGVYYDVLYKDAIVGSIGGGGEVILPLRLRKRGSIQSLFEGRVRV